MHEAVIDISTISRELAEAVTEDCSPITTARIIRLFHDNAYEAHVGDLLRWKNQGSLYAPALVLHFIYESWLQDIGTAVGVLPEEDMPPDAWVEQHAPKAVQIKRVLSRIAISGRAQIHQLAIEGEDDLTTLPVLRTSTFTREAVRKINTGQPIRPALRKPLD